uniref:NADH-ubiquinone oxidoreductase chain 6 n=1 Tax=Paratkina nigrifasciana TaxID=3004265 RepID=A0A9E9JMA7_9HEMI|nr:NADH dehydrogenase subunit 6 [Paratkina nigrifasciana]WAP91642.1 NADH dehydrogenase subunit 6 [Paratkina nigrifasciana]
MKMLFIKTLMISSSLIPTMKNPMSMGIILLMNTTIMTMIMNKMMLSSWFPMILFLMMVGGLLILFTYMSSIASNEKFKFKINLTFIMILIIIISEEMMNENQVNESQKINFSYLEMMSMTKLYNKLSMVLTIMLILYLLLTMIIVSKIVKHHEGPLRSKTYE